MVDKGKSRKDEVVTREYTIHLHKRLHGWWAPFLSLFSSLLLFLRFVFVCRPLSMSNSLGAKSSGLYFSRVCSASFDVFVRLWFLFLLYSPIPPPSGVLVILCFHDLMYQHQEISFWNVYPPFCGLLHRF